MNDSGIESSDGEPDLVLAGLRLWFGNLSDEGWLETLAICSRGNSTVSVSGQFMMLSDLLSWIKFAEPLYANLNGSVALNTLEDLLTIDLRVEKTGTLAVAIAISPDNSFEKHSFIFDADQTDLGLFLTDCRRISGKFQRE